MSYQQTTIQERTITNGPPLVATGEEWSNRALPGDVVIERCEYCPQREEEEKGTFENMKEKMVEFKDKITGNTPEKKAERYAKKCEKCLKKEHKYEKEAEKYAEKAADKSQKYADKATKELNKKEEMEGKAAVYHAKAVANAEQVKECRDAKIEQQADRMHDAACRIQTAH